MKGWFGNAEEGLHVGITYFTSFMFLFVFGNIKLLSLFLVVK